MCWHYQHIQLIDRHKLRGLGLGRSRHTGKLIVHSKVVLKGNRRKRLVLVLYLDLFLGLDGLMQPVAPPAPVHKPPGELVYYNDRAVFDDIVDILSKENVGAQALPNVMKRLDIARVIEVIYLQKLLDLCHTVICEMRLLCLLVDCIMFFGL